MKCILKNIKSVLLLLCFMFLTSSVISAQKYKHKSEAELARMTPSQRVDEWVNEDLYHRYDVLDPQRDLIRKYVLSDALKSLPRLIEIMDEYDPVRFREGKGGVRYDACFQMLEFIDNFAVRLRASEEGRRAIDAIDRSIERMRAADYAVKKDGDDWNNGKLELAVTALKDMKGVNDRDNDIKENLRFVYKIIVSNAELLQLSNFLTTNHPEYPSWSERYGVTDYTRFTAAGYPSTIEVFKKPERFYQAYLEFRKTNN